MTSRSRVSGDPLLAITVAADVERIVLDDVVCRQRGISSIEAVRAVRPIYERSHEKRGRYCGGVVPEADLEETGAGVVPASPGWFVMNARDARWFHREGRSSLPLTGTDEFEAETYFPMLGMSLVILAPGEANSMYHWETEQEDFLVVSVEALLIVEGQERRLPSEPSRYREGWLPG